MHFLNVLISKDAAGPLELTRALPGSSRDDGLMHAGGSQDEGAMDKKYNQEINALLNKGWDIFNTLTEFSSSKNMHKRTNLQLGQKGIIFGE